MKNQKEQHQKARTVNGAPYLKLKMVKVMPRQKIRQLLKSAIPFEELRELVKSQHTSA